MWISCHGFSEFLLESGADVLVREDIEADEVERSRGAGRSGSEQYLRFFDETLGREFGFLHVAVDDLVEERGTALGVVLLWVDLVVLSLHNVAGCHLFDV